jgi:enoyl-CoA hydratase
VSVDVERTGTVTVITIDEPHRNALTPALAGEIAAAMTEAETDPESTAIVISSGGPAYCSGADLDLLRAVAGNPLADEAYGALGAIYALFERMQDCTVPTLAAVNGAVVGAGVNLALACDARIVSDDLKVVGFGPAGVHPGGGHLSLLVQRVDRSAAASIALFAQPLNATRAVSSGFALESVPLADLRDRAIEIASAVGTDKALVVATTRSFREAAGFPLRPAAAVQLERAPQVWSLHRRFRAYSDA